MPLDMFQILVHTLSDFVANLVNSLGSISVLGYVVHGRTKLMKSFCVISSSRNSLCLQRLCVIGHNGFILSLIRDQLILSSAVEYANLNNTIQVG